MNLINLSGNLVKDIEKKTTNSGKSVVQNTIAVRNDFKNKNGEYESQFFNFVFYGQQADFLANYAKKGDKVLIVGRLNNRNYDKPDGTRVYITEVIGDRVEILTPKKQPTQLTALQPRQDATAITDTDEYKYFGEQMEIDTRQDELPF